MNEERKKISVVICAYNEERSIGKVFEKLRSLAEFFEIVVVNNGSTDKTAQVISENMKLDSRIKLIEIKKNKGLGHGFTQGVYATTGDIIVRQDADLEYDPFELMAIVEPILSGYASVCFGSRMLVRKAHKAQYFYNYLANKLFTFIADLLSNLNITDVETAAKAFDGNLARSIKYTTHGFQIEIEMFFKLRAKGAIFYEVPISYYGRTVEEGKKIRLKDAFTTLWALIYYGTTWKFLK
jgi:glycosyltransferase involved in cell wall biosynthesis